jgi:predicted AAA+ superfamily ATPase
MYKNRLLESKLKKVGNHFPVIVLTGARQTGKTTLLEHLLSEAEHITFDPIIDIGNARQDPEFFLQNLKLPALLDEVQYAPELLPPIKRMVDKIKTPGQFWLTGSQNLQVLRDISESLAGRAALLNLQPMTLGELKQQPNTWIIDYLQNPAKFLQAKYNRITYTENVYELLWRGGYPGMAELTVDLIHEAFSAYVHTYIERDIRKIGEISDWQQFSRFVQLIANLTAQEINFSQLGREIGISSKTSENWLNILIDTYQWHNIPAYSGNTIKRISSKPKGYFIDTGLACYLMHITSAKALAGHPRLGALFETYVAQELLKQLSLFPGNPAIYHWRSYAGAEVDLIIEFDNKIFPIEIKCKTNLTKRDVTGIKAFRNTYSHLNIEPAIIIAPVTTTYHLTPECFVVPFDITTNHHL